MLACVQSDDMLLQIFRNEVSDLDRSPLKAHVNWVEAVGRYKLGGLLSAVTSHLIIFPLPARIKTMCRS